MVASKMTVSARVDAARGLVMLGMTRRDACKRLGLNVATFQRFEGYRLARLAADHYLTELDGAEVACFPNVYDAIHRACFSDRGTRVRHVDGTIVWEAGMSATECAGLLPVSPGEARK